MNTLHPAIITWREVTTAEARAKVQVVVMQVDAEPGRVFRKIESGVLAKASLIVAHRIDDAIHRDAPRTNQSCRVAQKR
jgi:hypothetical protein